MSSRLSREGEVVEKLERAADGIRRKANNGDVRPGAARRDVRRDPAATGARRDLVSQVHVMGASPETGGVHADKPHRVELRIPEQRGYLAHDTTRGVGPELGSE